MSAYKSPCTASSAMGGRLVAACRRAWENGLLAGCNGNMSVRLGANCLISCSGAAKGHLCESDLASVRLSTGKCKSVRGNAPVPSSELGMHLALYNTRPDIGAIVHVHPAHLLSLSLRVPQAEFVRLPLFEAEKLRQRLAFAPALPPGSAELALAVARAASTADAIWMQGHGLTCVGPKLNAALALAEELEHLARVQLLAERILREA